MASLPRKRLFEVVSSVDDASNIENSCRGCLELFTDVFHVPQCDIPEEIRQSVTKSIRDFIYKLRRKWAESSRNKQSFERKNTDWLKGELCFD